MVSPFGQDFQVGRDLELISGHKEPVSAYFVPTAACTMSLR
jgi:hypothetical protein